MYDYWSKVAKLSAQKTWRHSFLESAKPQEIRENRVSLQVFLVSENHDVSSFPTSKHIKNCMEVPPPHLQGAEFSFRWLLGTKVFFVDLHILERHSEQMCHKMSCQMLKTSGWYEENLQVIPGCNQKSKKVESVGFPGTPKDMGPLAHPKRIPKDMGILWESYHKRGSHVLGGRWKFPLIECRECFLITSKMHVAL